MTAPKIGGPKRRYLPTFGPRLRVIRKSHDVTQIALARATGFTPPYIHDIETGRRSAPATKLDELIAAALATPDEAAELRKLAEPQRCPCCGQKVRP